MNEHISFRLADRTNRVVAIITPEEMQRAGLVAVVLISKIVHRVDWVYILIHAHVDLSVLVNNEIGTLQLDNLSASLGRNGEQFVHVISTIHGRNRIVAKKIIAGG